MQAGGQGRALAVEGAGVSKDHPDQPRAIGTEMDGQNLVELQAVRRGLDPRVCPAATGGELVFVRFRFSMSPHPGIEYGYAGRCEILAVASHHGHIVHHRGRGDECVAHRARVGHV